MKAKCSLTLVIIAVLSVVPALAQAQYDDPLCGQQRSDRRYDDIRQQHDMYMRNLDISGYTSYHQPPGLEKNGKAEYPNGAYSWPPTPLQREPGQAFVPRPNMMRLP